MGAPDAKYIRKPIRDVQYASMGVSERAIAIGYLPYKTRAIALGLRNSHHPVRIGAAVILNETS